MATAITNPVCRAPIPSNYFCKLCGLSAHHWIMDCSLFAEFHAARKILDQNNNELPDSLVDVGITCGDHSVTECPSLYRIIMALKFYQNNYNSFSNNALLDYFEFNRYNHLLNDYTHILSTHLDQDKEHNDINTALLHTKVNQFIKCQIRTCPFLIRQHHNQNENITFYKNTLETIWSIHCYFLHPFHTGFKMVKSQSCTHANCEENIHEDISCEDTELMQPQSKLNIRRDLLRAIRSPGKEYNQYSKFMIEQNVEVSEKLSEHDEKAAKRERAPKMNNYFDDSYYWEWYKNNEREDRRCNTDRKYRDLYISPKYENLKHEITENIAFRLNIFDFKIAYLSVIRKMKSFGNELCHYGIADGQWLKIHHPTSLILHCDYKHLSRKFVHTFRRDWVVAGMVGFEPDYYFWSRYLWETVELYGTPIKSKISIFYVSISNRVIFNSFSAGFCLPTSTTSQLEIVTMSTNNNGLILELKSTSEIASFYQGLLKYFNCGLISSFAEQDERLFIRVLIERKENYMIFIRAIQHFNAILDSEESEESDTHTLKDQGLLTVSLKSNKQLLDATVVHVSVQNPDSDSGCLDAPVRVTNADFVPSAQSQNSGSGQKCYRIFKYLMVVVTVCLFMFGLFRTSQKLSGNTDAFHEQVIYQKNETAYCNTTYDWRTYSLELPPQLPLPSYQKKVRSVPFSYYENVCTVSYTQAFWTWNEWETHLDWMAMQGINLPLAFTGQEYVFSKTFYQFNFTQADLQAFFSGPGFFAWQRMGNLRGWAGPISQECIMDQYNLQLNILARMNSFNMTPALTAFAGHVPYAITKYYPKADVIPSPNWWGSTKEYCCDLLLNFTDPLFSEIGAAFIQQQTKYFGSGHVYQCDTFNEMDPPTTSTKYLNSASKYVYDSMQMADKDAVWLMQGWLFQYHGFWKPAQVQAYVGGVPNGAMIILDLYDDVSPQYNQFESFYGTPFIWCTLHNFGGNQGLLGTLYNIGVGLPNAMKYPNSSVIGVGITMEGIWQNYIVYDETMKMAFEPGELDLNEYVDQYAMRRYGLPFSVQKTDQEMVINTMHNAWQQLATTVYNISHWGGVTKSLMCIRPSLNAITSGFMPTMLFYDPVVIQQVWRTFLTVSSTDIVNIEKYRYDLIDVSRQAISDQFFSYYKQLNASYHSKSVDSLTKYGNILIELMTDLDNLLNTNKFWMLGEWIKMSREHSGTNATEQEWWEFNARNQVTLWGPNGEISDYASKTWGGLIGTYHKPQWQLFIHELLDAVEHNVAFNQNAFNQKNMETIQQPWQHANNTFPVNPINDTIVIACQLYIKWNTLHDTTTCQ